ncbi:SpoIVB peptidase [Desulfofalx alkaliphila]|uniref:SpoIVB peptidase n=1 Tax=Desulfofalx alkaliphila TaxID=105483 RepID=UPI0004E25C3B|nr:SpoIVB peptidase [Desulfofalx alkaliphila]
MNDSRVKFFCFISILLLAVFCFNGQVMRLGTLPVQQKIAVGEPLDLGFQDPHKFLSALKVDIKTENELIMMYQGLPFKDSNFTLMESTPVVNSPGKVEMNVKLFGLIPLRQVTVDVVPQKKVMPGGQSIGVLLHSKGVIVVGISEVEDATGKQDAPANKAGIKIGDVILKINGEEIESEQQMRSLVNKSGMTGKPIRVQLMRQGKTMNVKVDPVYCKDTNSYRLGLFIRDTAAGIGTLTFYEPETSVYGALGHMITDAETGQRMELPDGKVIEATVQQIHPGQRGQPGEKVGLIKNQTSLSGTIEKNTPYGIFGQLSQPITNPFFDEPIPVALSHQIKEGPAEIITVLNGDKMEKFKINIDKVSSQTNPEGKGMIIRITDPKLLEITGGIIQGMSGSPIIQYTQQGDAVLVGAVTHVFINDPTSGYGVLAEWMLNESSTVRAKKNINVSRVKRVIYDNCA